MGEANPACKSKPEFGVLNPIVEWKKTEWAVKRFQPGISARRRVLGGSWSLKR